MRERIRSVLKPFFFLRIAQYVRRILHQTLGALCSMIPNTALAGCEHWYDILDTGNKGMPGARRVSNHQIKVL